MSRPSLPSASCLRLASSLAIRAADAVTASEARVAKEDANRKKLAEGNLGLDMYNLRPKLASVDYIDYAEYVRRAGEGA